MMKSNKPKKALQRRGKSFLFAARGIGFAVKTQPNFCFHLLAILLVTEFGLLYGLEKERWGLVLVFFCLIPALELVNTALEAVVDLVSPNYHPLAKVAKDCAAGAVLVAALGAVAAAVFLFGDVTRLSIALGVFVTTPWMWCLLAAQLIAAVVILLLPGKQSEHAASFSQKQKSEKKES